MNGEKLAHIKVCQNCPSDDWVVRTPSKHQWPYCKAVEPNIMLDDDFMSRTRTSCPKGHFQALVTDLAGRAKYKDVDCGPINQEGFDIEQEEKRLASEVVRAQKELEQYGPEGVSFSLVKKVADGLLTADRAIEIATEVGINVDAPPKIN